MPKYSHRPPFDEEIKWRYIKNDLIHGIAEGRWRENDRIPTESQLEADYGCSRSTVRRAVDEVCGLGLLKRRRAIGTFVLPGAQERARMLLRPDDVELRQPTAADGGSDGYATVTIHPPDDQVTFRLPSLAEAQREGIHRTDLLAIVWRADGSREVYPALNLIIRCKQPPPSE